MRFQAKLLEPAVWAEVIKLIENPDFAKKLLDKALKIYGKNSKTTKLEKMALKTKALTKQLEALAEHLAKIPKDMDPTPIFEQMRKIEKDKKDLKEQMESFKEALSEKKPMAFKDYRSFLEGIGKLLKTNNSPELRRKVCERLIHKIELMPEGFIIHFYMGSDSLSGPNQLGVSLNAGSALKLIENKSRKKLESIQKNGSNSLQNGGPRLT